MKGIGWIPALVLGVGLAAGSALAQVTASGPVGDRVDVFFTTTRPVAVSPAVRQRLAGAGIALALHDLDTPGRIEAELSRGLPTDPETALALAVERLEAADRDGRLARRLGLAYQGLTVALELGVDRLPAMVFGADREGVEPAVVYGVDDLAVALRLYLEWRRERTAGGAP